MTEFYKFPKIARLNRDMVITEKIDGTNAAIRIEDVTESYEDRGLNEYLAEPGNLYVADSGKVYHVCAQSRNQFITPERDNHGFARWVFDNAEALTSILGPGVHFGEWWGSGINRGYGFTGGNKRFSLFNVKRWGWLDSFDGFQVALEVPELAVVPVLYRGPFSTGEVRIQLECLEAFGSQASPGFMNPEGVVVYHTAANTMFKATIKNDDAPKTVINTKVVDVSPDVANFFEDATRRNREDIARVLGLSEFV